MSRQRAVFGLEESVSVAIGHASASLSHPDNLQPDRGRLGSVEMVQVGLGYPAYLGLVRIAPRYERGKVADFVVFGWVVELKQCPRPMNAEPIVAGLGKGKSCHHSDQIFVQLLISRAGPLLVGIVHAVCPT